LSGHISEVCAAVEIRVQPRKDNAQGNDDEHHAKAIHIEPESARNSGSGCIWSCIGLLAHQ
jgi:hypothetical protein